MSQRTHVIPSTLSVVVAMCAVGAASDSLSLEGTLMYDGAISPASELLRCGLTLFRSPPQPKLEPSGPQRP